MFYMTIGNSDWVILSLCPESKTIINVKGERSLFMRKLLLDLHHSGPLEPMAFRKSLAVFYLLHDTAVYYAVQIQLSQHPTPG